MAPEQEPLSRALTIQLGNLLLDPPPPRDAPADLRRLTTVDLEGVPWLRLLIVVGLLGLRRPWLSSKARLAELVFAQLQKRAPAPAPAPAVVLPTATPPPAESRIELGAAPEVEGEEPASLAPLAPMDTSGIEATTRAKFDLGARVDPRPAERIPWGYGEDRITAMVVDPDRLFLYWEVTDEGISRALRELHAPPDETWLNLRIHDVTDRIFDGTNAHGHRDVGISRQQRQWFVTLGKPTSWQVAEVGLKSKDGRFQRIARSRRVIFPRRERGTPAPVEWLTVREEDLRPAAGQGAPGAAFSPPQPLVIPAPLAAGGRDAADSAGTGANTPVRLAIHARDPGGRLLATWILERSMPARGAVTRHEPAHPGARSSEQWVAAGASEWVPRAPGDVGDIESREWPFPGGSETRLGGASEQLSSGASDPGRR